MKLHYPLDLSTLKFTTTLAAIALGMMSTLQVQADPVYPNYGFPPTNAAYPPVSGFESFQLTAPYNTNNPFDGGQLDAIEQGFELFTEETFEGNGRTCKSCHLPDKNYNIALEDFANLSEEDQDLALGGDNADLENEEAVTEAVLFNINQGAGDGTEGNIEEPDGPFRSSMTIGGVGFTVLNDHVCRVGVNTPQEGNTTPTACTPPGSANVAGAANNGVDDGLRDLMLGWSGEGPLEVMFPFVEPNPADTDAADCEEIIEAFDDTASSLRDLDLALATFALAAVKTHFPLTQNRQPGVDFRCPEPEELLDMAEFQKWLGRRFELDITQLEFEAEAAQHGLYLFSSRLSSCVACHVNASASDTQGRVKSDPVPFLTPEGDEDFEWVVTNREDLHIIGTNKTSRNGSQTLEDGLLAQFETFDFPFDPGDNQKRGSATVPFLNQRQGGFNVQSIIESVRNKQFFHNNGVTDSIEEALEFYFTPRFFCPLRRYTSPVNGPLVAACTGIEDSQGGGAIGADFRHIPATVDIGGVDTEVEWFLTGPETLELLGGDQAIADMGFFLRSLSSLYAVADCQRLVDEMLDRMDASMPVDLPSIHCTFALHDVNRILNSSRLESNPYEGVTAKLNGVNGKLQGLTAKLNGAGKNGPPAKIAKVRADVRAGLVKLAEELLVLRRGIATTPELNDPI